MTPLMFLPFPWSFATAGNPAPSWLGSYKLSIIINSLAISGFLDTGSGTSYHAQEYDESEVVLPIKWQLHVADISDGFK